MTIQTPISPALEAFGKAVKAERQAREWSLATLAAEALGNPDRKGYCSQVEKGLRKLSEGSIRSFARALDLPASVIDPLTGHFLPSEDDTTQSDAAAAALLHEVEALRDKLKLSEALAVAIAYKYADGNPTDIEGALKGLEAALELAAKDQERGRLPSNYEDAAEAVIQRVNALNAAGEIDQAYADLQAEAARRAGAMAAQKAEDGRILDLLITQAALANDAEGYAQAQLQKVQLDSPGAEETFQRLHGLFMERYTDGFRLGTPFALSAAASLARACIRTAPTPYQCAMAQNDLAIVLAKQGTRALATEGNTLLSEAVEYYRAALTVRNENDHPVEWAITMQNLALALESQGARIQGTEGNSLLAKSVECYRSALHVLTEANHSLEWACAIQNLASVLETQATRTQGTEGNAVLAEAVESYRAALRVFREAEHPVDWAMTLQNLAGALATQGTRTQGAKGNAFLREAAESLRAALRVRTEAVHPVDWAMTMQNLANVLATQGSRSQGDEGNSFLSEAVEYFLAALRVRTEADHPMDWAITQENLAFAEHARAKLGTSIDPRLHLEAALAHVDNALRIYDPVHLSYDHGRATALRNHILHALDTLDTPPPSSSS